MRSIPDDNLALPVLIQIPFGKANRFGTGFFFNSRDEVFLVTAKHVLMEKGKIVGPKATLTAQTVDPKDDSVFKFEIDFKKIQTTFSIAHDVAVFKMGKMIGEKFTLDTGVTLLTPGKSPLVQLTEKLCLGYDDVLISNDVFIFGYPVTIGLHNSPQFDYGKPLLKKGIVAAKNKKNKTIVLDCMVFGGNSGGPVIQVSRTAAETQLRVIGVMIEYIPYVQKREQKILANSGYSLAVSIETVIEVIKSIQK